MADLTHEYWKNKVKELNYPNLAFIDGKPAAAQSGNTFDCVNPATGQVLTQIADCDASDVELATQAARRSFEGGYWSKLAPSERKAVMMRIAALIMENQQELALLESLDTGKPIMDAYNIDIAGAAAIFGWYAEVTDKVYDEIAPTHYHSLATITREPIGIVGSVVPWNFPLDSAIWKIAPALAAGNSMVLKPAELSSLTALRFAELAVEGGLPAGVLNVVTGSGPAVGEPIGRHPDIDCLTFTGSTPVGKRFLQYSAESNMKPVWLETGGKSPNIVFADCGNLDLAADKAAFGIFWNQGEICSANSRLLVERSIKDEFVAKLQERCAARQPGDPLNPDTLMGAIIDSRQTDSIMSYIEKGQSEGATLVAGGQRCEIGGSNNYVQPTIFDDVTNNMVIAREEIFGPVLSVIAFDDEKEAIAIANDTPYGLAASVWTDNLHRAHRVAKALKAGTVSVNTVDALSPMTPFGGYKQSGIGRDLSIHAIDKYTQVKTTWFEINSSPD